MRNPLELVLLTWHGKIVCRASDWTLVQRDIRESWDSVGVWRLRPRIAGEGIDFAQWIAASGGELTLDIERGAVRGDIALEKRPGDRTMLVQVASGNLFAPDDGVTLTWNSTRRHGWETFFCLTLDELRKLSTLLSGSLSLMGGPSEKITNIRMADGFHVVVDGDLVSLDLVLTGLSEIVALSLPQVGGATLRAAERYEVLPSVPLSSSLVRISRRASSEQPRKVLNVEAFRIERDCQLDLSLDSSTYLIPPIMISAHDDEWFRSHYYRGDQPPLGYHRDHCIIYRESSKYLALSRGAEGVIFDDQGSSNRWQFLTRATPWPDYLKQVEGHVYVDRSALQDEAVLSANKKLFVFFNGYLENFYHWMLEGMVILDVFSRLKLDDFTILMPGTIKHIRKFDFVNIIEVLGFGSLPLEWYDETLIKADEVLWLDMGRGDLVEGIPAEHLLAFNARIGALLDASQSEARLPKRIFIRRRGGRSPSNFEAVEDLVRSWGFSTFILEDMAFSDQLALFRNADFVIAPHGAGLANLVFCRQGTKVLEIMPEAEMRPFFWLLSSKIGLIHGMICCPSAPEDTSEPPFDRLIQVDLGRLTLLFEAMESRLQH